MVERHGEPAIAVIPYADYVALQEALDDLRDARLAQATLDEWRRDPTTARSWEAVRSDLRDDGLIDD